MKWQNGVAEAVERMREHLADSKPVRFDARDRLALTFLLDELARLREPPREPTPDGDFYSEGRQQVKPSDDKSEMSLPEFLDECELVFGLMVEGDRVRFPNVEHAKKMQNAARVHAARLREPPREPDVQAASTDCETCQQTLEAGGTECADCRTFIPLASPCEPPMEARPAREVAHEAVGCTGGPKRINSDCEVFEAHSRDCDAGELAVMLERRDRSTRDSRNLVDDERLRETPCPLGHDSGARRHACSVVFDAGGDSSGTYCPDRIAAAAEKGTGV